MGISVKFIMVLTMLKCDLQTGPEACCQVDLKTRQEKLFLIVSLIGPSSGDSNFNFESQSDGRFLISRCFNFCLVFLVMYKNDFIRKRRLISKFMTSQPGQQAIAIHILPYISRSIDRQ